MHYKCGTKHIGHGAVVLMERRTGQEIYGYNRGQAPAKLGLTQETHTLAYTILQGPRD